MKKSSCRAKKAQAAMEFLSTYGWAVLILALVLVAIAWLGIFNVPGQVQDRCAFPVGTFICNDAFVSMASPAGVKTNLLERITLTNKFGKTITICGVNCSAQPPVPGTGLPAGVASITVCPIGSGTGIGERFYSDEKKIFTLGTSIVCKDAAGGTDTSAVGSRYVGTLYVQYFMADTPGLQTARIITGDIVATVQQASG